MLEKVLRVRLQVLRIGKEGFQVGEELGAGRNFVDSTEGWNRLGHRVTHTRPFEDVENLFVSLPCPTLLHLWRWGTSTRDRSVHARNFGH